MRKLIPLAVLASFILLCFPQSFATVPPTVCSVSSSSGAQTFSKSFTSSVSSVTLTSPISLSGCNSIGTLFIFTVWYPISSASNSPISPLSVSDNASNVYTQEASTGLVRCVGNSAAGSCPGYTFQSPMISFIAPFTAANGHLSVTISSTSNFPYSGTFYGSWMFVQGLSNLSVASSCTGQSTYDSVGLVSVQPVGGAQDSCTVNAPSNSMIYYFQLNTVSLTDGGVPFPQIGGFGFYANQNQQPNVNTDNCSAWSTFYCQQNATGQGQSVASTISVGLACSTDCDGVSIAFIVLALGSSSSTSGIGVTVSEWNPSGLAAVSGSSTYLSKETLYTYQDGNGQTGAGTVYNFTTKVAAAHCAKVYCYILVGFYMAQTPGLQPSASNPLKLQQPQYTIAIANGTTTATVESQNVTVLILPNYWWAVGIMSNSTASRGSGASGTGVSIYQATWVNQMYGTSTVSTSFPVTTPPGIGAVPALYFKAALTFPIVTTTQTSTTTVTTGTYTTTITEGSTTTVNNITPASPTYWYFPILFLGSGFTIFAGIKIMTRRGG